MLPAHAKLYAAAGALALALAGPRLARGDAAGTISVPPGFRAELVYSVPLEQQGSWVCLTVDGRGRLIASDQNGALYRLQPSPLGGPPAATKVEAIPMSIGMAQGMVVRDEKLYVVMNGQLGAFGSGLYRLSDSNGDDQFDRLEQLRMFQGAGEHGPHAVALGPDGNSLYVVCGNATGLPLYSRSLVPPQWGEDQLLPRIMDPMGMAAALKAPGGWICRTDLQGKNLELFSVGYRNAYDIAFNADGELFTFDSDMEWDIGTPWYRTTRVCHVTSGSDYGWRSGNGPWPQYYADTLPVAAEVGPGSPTGLAFGAGTKFPGRYQAALFAGDWSYGNIYAIHLAPEGATYRGEVERFAWAMPLGVTDMVVRPQDGALYFTVGGRQSESAVYRIVATGVGGAAAAGSQAAQPPNSAGGDPAAGFRAARRAVERFHGGPQAGAIEAVWPQLASPDRFMRHAARVAVEQQPVDRWRERALAEPDPAARVQALAALARTAPPGVQAAWAKSLAALPFAEAGRQQRLDILRAAALGVIRFDPLDPAVREQLIAAFDPHFPAGDHIVDRELAPLVIRLGAAGVVPRALEMLQRAATEEEAVDAATALSAIREGWTRDQRVAMLDWFDRAASLRGGQSSFGYMVSARDRFVASFTSEERAALAERIARPLVASAEPATGPARPFVREWTLDELATAAEKDAGPRDLANGRRMFAAATCYSCHRVAGEGSSVGPDLTGLGGRFGVRDILRSIVEPNHEVSDQYRPTVFEANGRTITGRITNLTQDKVLVSTNMLDPKAEIAIRRSDIEKQYPADASLMPAGLLNTLSEAEVLDLLAYLRSGGGDGQRAARASAGGR